MQTKAVSEPAQSRLVDAGRIDVHAHFLPDFYRAALIAAGVARPDGMPAIPLWSEPAALSAMDELGVRTAILSVSSPGAHFGDDDAARKLARRINTEGQRLRTAYPGRFGFFASVPLPDVAAAIDEASFALDELHADGIIVESNHNGMYLGDERLEPFFAALDARRAALFIHPTSPACAGCETLALGYPRPMLEFMFETTRTVTNMILSGVTLRYPNMRVIVPHAGAALPVLAARIELIGGFAMNGAQQQPDVRAELRKLYYDLAGAPVPELLNALLEIADPSRIFYGSDWPFTPLGVCKSLAANLDAVPTLDARRRAAIMYGNALAFFPDLGAANSTTLNQLD